MENISDTSGYYLFDVIPGDDYLGFFDEKKDEERIAIDGIVDIHNFADQIIAIVQRYDSE